MELYECDAMICVAGASVGDETATHLVLCNELPNAERGQVIPSQDVVN